MQKQTYTNFLVYLVDNGSKGEDATILKQQFSEDPRVQLILNKENLGFTKGNNEILRKYILPNKDYKYVLLLNNDTAVDENWIQALLKAAEQQQAHIVSSKMINYFDRNRMDNAGHQMLSTGEVIPVSYTHLTLPTIYSV